MKEKLGDHGIYTISKSAFFRLLLLINLIVFYVNPKFSFFHWLLGT